MERRQRKNDLSTNMNHEAAMDSFIGKLGLYRKPIAKDGSCLFRAVAEQVSMFLNSVVMSIYDNFIVENGSSRSLKIT